MLFLSQQAYSGWVGKTLISAVTNEAAAGLSKVSVAAQSRGEMIKTEVNQGKKSSENIGSEIENYFSGVANSILHPKQSNSCPIQQSQTSTCK